MIIFDLDGTLAECDHRRHFVDPSKNTDYEYSNFGYHCVTREPTCDFIARWHRKDNWDIRFKPDWKAFYEACDKDTPILPVIKIFKYLVFRHEVQIWSGRCESTHKKTCDWLFANILDNNAFPDLPFIIKMRPIGDNTPDDILKEKWLDEALAEENKIDFVFDDRPKVVRMWRRRGIFVFNCNQSDEDF